MALIEAGDLVRTQTMQSASQSTAKRDKPNWHQKVFGEDIVQKWRDEAREQPEDGLFARIMQDNVSKFIPKPIIEDQFWANV
ncbi:hypothetical protein Neosp_013532 [[Neocosmospora] mangrovei]